MSNIPPNSYITAQTPHPFGRISSLSSADDVISVGDIIQCGAVNKGAGGPGAIIKSVIPGGNPARCAKLKRLER